MFSLHNLQVTRVLPDADGTLLFAKYPDSAYEHAFLVEPEGSVKTKTVSGLWVDLGRDAATLISDKLKAFLTRRNSRSARSVRKFIIWSRNKLRDL